MTPKNAVTPQSNEPTKANRALTVIGIVLCVLLIPILILNVTLIVKSLINPDVVPTVGGYLPQIVLSDSMEDTIKGGDLIVCRVVDPDDIREGDVISFFDPDPRSSGTAIITHRVEKIIYNDDGTYEWQTKGDRKLQGTDPYNVPPEKLVARWDGFRIPWLGSIAMFLQRPIGLVLCVLTPVLLFVGYDLISRRKLEQESRRDTEQLLAELEVLRAQKAEAERRAEATAADDPPPSESADDAPPKEPAPTADETPSDEQAESGD